MNQPPLQPTPVGAIRFNTDSSKLEYYDGNQWVNITSDSPAEQTGGTRGLMMGGNQPAPVADYINIISYANFDTTGNFTDFGNLQAARRAGGCVTGVSASRMCIGGGYDQGQHEGSTMQDIIGYIATASTGNASDFGNLTVKRYAVSACGSSDRGVWCFGQQSGSPSYTDIMDYITISSTGNATDFGDTQYPACLLYTSPSPRDRTRSRMPSSA